MTHDETTPETGGDVLQELQAIHAHLRRMDRRDRMRTAGGFVKGLAGLIPIALFLYFSWYLVRHGDRLLEDIAMHAAKQAGEITQGQMIRAMEELETQDGFAQ